MDWSRFLRAPRAVDGVTPDFLLRRIRMIPSIIIAGNASFAAADPWLHADALAPLSAVKICVVAIQLLALHLLRASLDPTRMIAIGLACFAVGAFGGTVAGYVTSEWFTTPLLCVAGALSMAAVVPWGGFAQLISGAISVLAGAATIVLVSGLAPAGYPMLALIFIAAISVYIAFELARQRAAEAHAIVALQQHQAELAHVLRVGAMGEMAAQLAHELTQPLGAIANYAAGCRRRFLAMGGAADDLVAAVDRIGSEALRAGEIIRRLRGVVRKAEPNRSLTDVNALARDVVALIEPEARASHVAVQLDLRQNLPAVDVDAIQIEQVIINLVRNALDALRESAHTPRTLEIATQVDDAAAIEVAVSDSGVGLVNGDDSKLFEPFYTTKEGGLGMGLAISRAIIDAHGGRLWCTPNPMRGLTFRFTLPAPARGARRST